MECNYLAKKFDPEKCCAAVKQSNNCPEQCPLNGSNKHRTGLHFCDAHNQEYENGSVEIFAPCTELYYQINQTFKRGLLELTKKYQRVKTKLTQKKKELIEITNAYKEQIDEQESQEQKIEGEIMELTIEISGYTDTQGNSDELEKLTQSIQGLQREKEQLKKSNAELKQKLDIKLQLQDSCDTSIRDMLVNLRKMTEQIIYVDDVPMPDIGDIEGDTVEQKIARKRKVYKQKVEKAHEKLLNGGLFTLIRIRCDEIEDVGNITKLVSAEWTDANLNIKPFLKIGETTELKVRNAQTIVYNDSGGTNCTLDKFTTQKTKYEKDKNKALDDLQALFIKSETNKISGAVNELKLEWAQTFDREVRTKYSNYISTSKKLSEDKQKDTFSKETWSTFLDDYIIDAKDVNTKKANQKLWIENVKTLHDVAEKEIKSAVFVLLSGKDFIDNSSIGFVGKQKYEITAVDGSVSYHPENLLSAITIIGIGGSGAGKTVATKALLQNIIRIYGDTYPEFIKQCKVEVSFQQVFANNSNQIIVKNMPKDQIGVQDVHTKESMERSFATSAISDEKAEWHTVCNNCESLTNQQSQVAVLKMIHDYDIATEAHRLVRSTLNNVNGSSRSIKIIQIKLTHVTGKIVKLNLIDTAGYENYTGQSEDVLNKFYVKQLMHQRDTNSKFQIQIPVETSSVTELKQDRTKRLQNNAIEILADKIVKIVLKEGEFIRNSLTYIEDAIVAFAKKDDIPPGKLHETWLADYLKVGSTVIVLAAFKVNMNPTEVPSAEATLKLLEKIGA